jgi:type I restriction enzyme S subunit
MGVRPGYKQTEVGIFPDEWECVTLGDLISLQRGHDLTWRDRRPGDVPVMGSAGQNGFHDTAIAKAPGVVLGRSGASFGQAHYCERDFWPHNTALYVTDFRGNSPLFVFYFLKSIDFSRHNSGGAQQSLNRNFISPIAVGVPQPLEQRAIAAALSDVDALLGGLDRLIAKKRDLKQAAMQQLLTGQTRLPGFCGAWEVKRLDEVAEVIDPHPSHRAPAEVSNGVPFVGIGDLDEGGSIVGTKLRYVDRSVLIEHAARYNLSDELIGLGRVASIGKVVCLKALSDGYAISPTLGIIRGRTAKRGFLLYALRSKFITEQFTRIMSGSTRSSVGMEVLRKLNVSLPPSPEEQTAIAAVLSDMDAELTALEARSDKTSDLKQAMMQELLTGKTRLVKPEAARA